MQKQNCNRGALKKIEEELILGRELATQLLLSHVVPNISSSSPRVVNTTTSSNHLSTDVDDDLVMKIFDSFANCIGLLCSPDQYQTIKLDTTNHDQNSANYNIMDTVDLVDPKSPKSDIDDEPNSEEEEEEEGVKYSYTIASPIIDQNQISSGSVHNKRRKLTTSIWERNSPVLVDDGYAWRKYGQKMIRNAKYSRDYFRCSNKNDQGCKATKQVQKISDNPQVYKTIYHGHHTCVKDLVSTLPSDFGTTIPNYDDHHDDNSSGFLISFGETNQYHNKTLKKEDCPFLSSFKSTKIDQPKTVVLLDDHPMKIDQQVQQPILTSDGHDLRIKPASEPSIMHVLSPSPKSSSFDVDFGAFLESDIDFTNLLHLFEF